MAEASRPQPKVMLKQDRIFEFMGQYCASAGGRPPTIHEMAEALGIDSTSMITGYLKGLEARGLVEHHLASNQRQSRSWWMGGGVWRPPHIPSPEPIDK